MMQTTVTVCFVGVLCLAGAINFFIISRARATRSISPKKTTDSSRSGSALSGRIRKIYVWIYLCLSLVGIASTFSFLISSFAIGHHGLIDPDLATGQIFPVFIEGRRFAGRTYYVTHAASLFHAAAEVLMFTWIVLGNCMIFGLIIWHRRKQRHEKRGLPAA